MQCGRVDEKGIHIGKGPFALQVGRDLDPPSEGRGPL